MGFGFIYRARSFAICRILSLRYASPCFSCRRRLALARAARRRKPRLFRFRHALRRRRYILAAPPVPPAERVDDSPRPPRISPRPPLAIASDARELIGAYSPLSQMSSSPAGFITRHFHSPFIYAEPKNAWPRDFRPGGFEASILMSPWRGLAAPRPMPAAATATDGGHYF